MPLVAVPRALNPDIDPDFFPNPKSDQDPGTYDQRVVKKSFG